MRIKLLFVISFFLFTLSLKSAEVVGFYSDGELWQADSVYLRKNRGSQSPNQPEWSEKFVRNQKITTNFDLVRNWKLLKYAVENYDVGRIFVDRVIKKSFCEYALSLTSESC
jgi:hypothetical protein